MRPQTKTEKKEDNTMETMNVKDFYFDLPQELIAQDPLEDRSSSRLLARDFIRHALIQAHAEPSARADGKKGLGDLVTAETSGRGSTTPPASA